MGLNFTFLKFLEHSVQVPSDSWTSFLFQERALERLKVNVQADDQLEHIEFDTRRAWSIKVTQIPCGCSPSAVTNRESPLDYGLTPEYVPKAPSGCLQFHEGISGDIKSFNYDSLCCYRY